MRHFDLCVIGSGSGNSLIDHQLAGWSVALVDKGVFGGTCLNVGCIPTKMYVYPADLADSPTEASRVGVDLSLDQVHWPKIRDRIFGRIDAISEGGRDWRAQSSNVTLFERPVRFVGDKTLLVEAGGGEPEETFTADYVVLAAGSRAVVPPFPGIGDVTFHTSDTVMRLDELPDRMVIVGGGYIASEFAHVFSALGTQVTVLNRSGAMLGNEDAEVSRRFTEQLGRRVDIRLNTEVDRLAPGLDSRGVTVTARTLEQTFTLEADVLLMATGRRSNADTLDLDRTGVEVDEQGRVVADPQQRTSAPGIFSLGDVSSHHQLKHVANHESRVVQHNLLHPEAMKESDHRYVPHAVFSSPQVASVGITEQDAIARGIPHVVGMTEYASTAYGWAMEDEGHFVKVIADPHTDLLLGAHLIGPQASSMIQPLIQAMHFGTRAHDVARGQYWIHPAMIEVVENALLDLPTPS